MTTESNVPKYVPPSDAEIAAHIATTEQMNPQSGFIASPENIDTRITNGVSVVHAEMRHDFSEVCRNCGRPTESVTEYYCGKRDCDDVASRNSMSRTIH